MVDACVLRVFCPTVNEMSQPILPGAKAHGAHASAHVPNAHASAPAPRARKPAGPWALPNLLTYARIAAVPVVVGCMYWSGILEKALWPRWVALAVFIAAAITDILDGYLARSWDQQSALGRMLDPIADKLLVSASLLMLAAADTIRGWSLLAAVVILCREILVSGLREYLAELRVSLPVTRLAKWKTTWQLVAVGFLLAGEAGDQFIARMLGRLNDPDIVPVTTVGLTLLWISAIVTLYTGWDYFRAGLRHVMDE
jgi:CDP-diacylglycerol--glycerol-3-phosphate 3-phosphatidyltransferase